MVKQGGTFTYLAWTVGIFPCGWWSVQEEGHDEEVVQGEPVGLPQSQPLCAADTENSQGEGNLVDHLHLVDLLIFTLSSTFYRHFHGRSALYI